MKTCLNRVAAIATIAALAVTTQPAFADDDHAAMVIKGESCTAAVPTEDGRLLKANTFVDPSGRTQRVGTSSGNKFLMCKFDAPAALVPPALRTATGFGCRVGDDGERTTDTQLLVAPSGKGMMLCKLN